MSDRTIITMEKINGRERVTHQDTVVREEAVTIYVNDTEMVTMVCSPTHLMELCFGFLYSEGLITAATDINETAVNEQDGIIWVKTGRLAKPANTFLKRHFASCCGRGRASFYFINDTEIKPVDSNIKVLSSNVTALREDMEHRSELFSVTGGAHSAAISNGREILAFFEDVGRHNALDKITGWCLMQEITTANKIILFSGRVSSEIVLKTARLGVPVIVSRSAPTNLALELADQLNVTVVGFARSSRMNVYTHGGRVE